MASKTLSVVEVEQELPVVYFDHEIPGYTQLTVDLEGQHIQAMWQTPKAKG